MSQPDPVIPQRPARRPDPARFGGTRRLASYLTAGVTGATMATAHSEAAVVAINLGASGLNLLGQNGGVSVGSTRSISDWLGPNTGTLAISNNSVGGQWGLSGSGGLQFAILPGQYATPRRFAAAATIDNSASSFSSDFSKTVFGYDGDYFASDFSASPKSYMGFRFASGGGYQYGYLEVTWNSASTTWEILSGAYESTVNTAILAGASPVPAPSALALLALGGGAFRRARARAA